MVIFKFKGKEFFIILILMILFGFGGIIFGMVEEILLFYMIFVLFMIFLGYDFLIVIVIVFIGVVVGVVVLIINLFLVGIV